MAIKKESIVISLGGSLICPDSLDLGFLKKFKFCIDKYLDRFNFIIVAGGGKVVRNYQNVLLSFGSDSKTRDLIGISISKINAEIIRNLFLNQAGGKIISDPNLKEKTIKPIMIGAGFKPGYSTDYVSVLLAKTYSVKKIINLTNVDYVYDKNPARFLDAMPIKNIDWKSFLKIVGNKWTPGMSAPFDPRASALAFKNKLEVVIINGTHLNRFEDFLNQKDFIGTIIK